MFLATRASRPIYALDLLQLEKQLACPTLMGGVPQPRFSAVMLETPRFGEHPVDESAPRYDQAMTTEQERTTSSPPITSRWG